MSDLVQTLKTPLSEFVAEWIIGDEPVFKRPSCEDPGVYFDMQTADH